VSAERAQEEYRRLVRRWHPDRYAADPQGQAEASLRMRQINAAFAVIRPLLSPASVRTSATSPSPDAVSSMSQDPMPFGRRLRQEEVDAIVASLRGTSMFERLYSYGVRGGLLASGITLLGIGPPHQKPLDVLLGGALIITVSFQILLAAIRARR